MNGAIAAIIAFLPTLASMVSDASTAAKVISWLETLVPLVVQGAEDLAQPIKNLIADLRGSGQVSADDLDKLDAYEAQIDAAFDSAATKAEAADAADKPAT